MLKTVSSVLTEPVQPSSSTCTLVEGTQKYVYNRHIYAIAIIQHVVNPPPSPLNMCINVYKHSLHTYSHEFERRADLPVPMLFGSVLCAVGCAMLAVVVAI